MNVFILADDLKDSQWVEQMLGTDLDPGTRFVQASILEKDLDHLLTSEVDAVILYRPGWAQLSEALAKIHAVFARYVGRLSNVHPSSLADAPLQAEFFPPVIAIGESGGWGDRTHALEAGAFDYLSRLQAGSSVLPVTLKKAFQVRSLQKEITLREQREAAISNLISEFAFSVTVQTDGLIELEWITGAYPDLDRLGPNRAFNLDQWKHLFHAEDFGRVIEAIDTLIKGRPLYLEFRLIDREGSTHWMRFQGRPQLDETGLLVRIFGTGSDITAHRKADQHLKDRLALEEFLASISARFLSAPVEHVEQLVQAAFDLFGRSLHLDGIELFFQAGPGPLEQVHTCWRHAPGSDLRADAGTSADLPARPEAGAETGSNPSELQYPSEQPRWLADQLQRFEPISVPAIDDLPEAAAAERMAWQQRAVQSVLVLPLAWKGSLAGRIEFTRAQPGAWEKDEIRLLQQLSDVMASVQSWRRSEETLIESESRYRQITDSISDVIAMQDPRGKLLYISPSVEKLFGRTVEEMASMPFDEVLHPADRERTRAYVDEHIARQQNCIYQARVVWPRGQIVWIETTLTLLLDSQGQIDRILSTSRDISIHKHAEELLRQAKQERDQLISSVSDALWSADVTSTGRWSYRYLSPVIERITGYAAEDFIRQPRLAVEIILEEDRPMAMQKFVLMNRALQPRLEIEYRIRRRDGSVRWIRDSQLAHRLDDITVRLNAVLSDVTERKQAQEELEHAHENLSFVTASVSDFIWSGELNSDGSLTARYISPVVEKITGLPPDYFAPDFKERWSGILFAEDLRLVEKAFNSVIQGAREYEIEYRIQRSDHLVRWVRDSVRARQAGPRVYQLNGVITDITERKIAEQALQEANEQLQLTIDEIKERNQQISLVNEMGDLMQSCLKVNDVYEILSAFGARLFPGNEGGLFMLDERKRLVEVATSWGDELHTEMLFEPEDCWALRRGRVHSSGATTELDCPHVDNHTHTPYLCIPMIAHGDTLGLFYLQSSGDQITSRFQETAVLVAERVALALANLRLHESLQDQSIRDSLTGLFNRRYMEDTTERELRQAMRHQYGLGIIIMDIDNFKNFNDSYGHGAGDILLQSISEYVRDNIRGGDIACRYGGDEFVLVLPNSDLESTTERAMQLQEGIHRLHVTYHGQPLGTISMSMGVAAYPDHGDLLELLLRLADKALYRAKELGKDRVIVA